jgi:hypothetical protein
MTNDTTPDPQVALREACLFAASLLSRGIELAIRPTGRLFVWPIAAFNQFTDDERACYHNLRNELKQLASQGLTQLPGAYTSADVTPEVLARCVAALRAEAQKSASGSRKLDLSDFTNSPGVLGIVGLTQTPVSSSPDESSTPRVPAFESRLPHPEIDLTGTGVRFVETPRGRVATHPLGDHHAAKILSGEIPLDVAREQERQRQAAHDEMIQGLRGW